MRNLIRLSTQTVFLLLCREIIAEHASELTIRRNQLTHTGGDGALDNSKWAQEVEFFIDQIVEPQVGSVRGFHVRLEAVRGLIDAATVDYLSSRVCFCLDKIHGPYEQLVSSSLRDLGWYSQLIHFSNDDQSDVMAEMRDIQVLIHCRRYCSSVGMLAIENARQRQLTSGATHTAIVSDGSFTDRARHLARSRSVILLHHN